MASIDDISIVPFRTCAPRPADYGIEKVVCDADRCGATTLTVYARAVQRGRRFEAPASKDYQLIYVIETAEGNTLSFGDKSQHAEEGAGVLLVPGDAARFDASAGEADLLHIVVPPPPAAVESELPGGPGYFFNRALLPALTDSSGGRIRRFCAESSIRLRDGRRLTSTNALQAGEMHYIEGGASPYHVHSGTQANPQGASHCYITFRGHGLVEVEGEFREIEPRTLVYFPPGVPHRLRSHGGPLDYFEIQAWRSFRTKVLSEEPLGLKWFYERENANNALIEWNQS